MTAEQLEKRAMKLSEFCAKFSLRVDSIITYSGKNATKEVKNDGYALRYVKEQTPDICIKAVENDGDALQYVKEQTPDICIKAVENNGYALQYVNPSIFDPEDSALVKPDKIKVDDVKYRCVA